jgi:hypothetical protein
VAAARDSPKRIYRICERISWFLLSQSDFPLSAWFLNKIASPNALCKKLAFELVPFL